MMFNKRMFRKVNDKKLLHKIGKRWVVVSAVLLGLLGGGAVATTGVSHAASVAPAKATAVTKPNKTAKQATPTKPQANQAKANTNANANNNQDVSVTGNPVTYQGNVNLQFHNQNGKAITSITQPYSANSIVGNKVTVLNPKAYLNKTIDGFSTEGFTNDQKANDYTFEVQPSDGPQSDGNIITKDYSLGFTTKQTLTKAQSNAANSINGLNAKRNATKITINPDGLPSTPLNDNSSDVDWAINNNDVVNNYNPVADNQALTSNNKKQASEDNNNAQASTASAQAEDASDKATVQSESKEESTGASTDDAIHSAFQNDIKSNEAKDMTPESAAKAITSSDANAIYNSVTGNSSVSSASSKASSKAQPASTSSQASQSSNASQSSQNSQSSQAPSYVAPSSSAQSNNAPAFVPTYVPYIAPSAPVQTSVSSSAEPSAVSNDPFVASLENDGISESLADNLEDDVNNEVNERVAEALNNKPAKHVNRTKHAKKARVRVLRNANLLKVGQRGYYRGIRFNRVRNHGKRVISLKGDWLYNTVFGGHRAHVANIKRGQKARLVGTFKIQYKHSKRVYTRFEVKIGHHIFYMTGNRDFAKLLRK